MFDRVSSAQTKLRLSIGAIYEMLHGSRVLPSVAQESALRWAGSELERLAGEAYRLADEAGDDPCASPIPGFDEPPKSS